MARVKMNDLIKTFGGSLGNIVFRSWNGKTYVYCKPRAQSKRKQSHLQKENGMHFRSMAYKAKCMLLNPQIRAHYQQEADRLKLPNACTALLKELLGKKSEDNLIKENPVNSSSQ